MFRAAGHVEIIAAAIQFISIRRFSSSFLIDIEEKIIPNKVLRVGLVLLVAIVQVLSQAGMQGAGVNM
eukprot:scaffold28378_cov223-Skeletonema_marinoi.AAC.22